MSSVIVVLDRTDGNASFLEVGTRDNHSGGRYRILKTSWALGYTRQGGWQPVIITLNRP